MSYDLILGHGTTIVDTTAGTVTPLGGSVVLSVGPQMLRNGGSKYHGELQYLGLLKELVDIHDEDPTPRDDRTGTGTFSVFGRQIRFDLAVGFPLLTTKEVNFKAMVAELLWMLSGSTNINDLDAKIWNQWADENGDLGPVYGKQWRDSQGIDQIAQLIQNLKDKPNDRGHVVSAWNVGDLSAMHLRPCHCLFQFYVQDGKLSCQLYQRSADIFLGVPFNIASYALLTHLIARECGLEVGEFVHTFGDLHLYANHVAQAKEQLTRTPTPFPHLSVDPIMFSEHGIFGILPGHISVDNYRPSGPIKAEVSV